MILKLSRTLSQTGIWIPSAAFLFFSLTAAAQYPGQITTKSDSSPDLRAISVLEWIGDAAKPKASRIVPVAIFDGEKLQDGGLYLARPMPMSLAGEVEYSLEQNGKPFGLFDIANAGMEQGAWVGYGKWKPLPTPKTESKPAKIDAEDEYSDRPTLHRKHPTGDSDSTHSTTSTAPEAAPPADPDRPTLHKKTAPAADTTASSTPDANRPVLKKSKDADSDEADTRTATDPDRPRLRRGKPSDYGKPVLPSLMGLPPDMQQAIAISDAKTRPEHLWSFEWSNPDDKIKMQTVLEDMARKALAPPAPPAPKRAVATTRRTAKSASTPTPVTLEGEQFHVFELAYSSGATLVLSAHTSNGPLTKYVTLIAQPDLYGNVAVLLKNVTDSAHLDITPRMRLIDAVDAEADNRGELLFELRGATQRQFALYRILRGEADKIFVNNGADIAVFSTKN